MPSRLKSLVNGDIRESVILSTCNRTEIYALSLPGAETSSILKMALSTWSGIAPGDIEQYLFAFVGEEAVRHLIRVAAGLDSLAVGEQQIQDQVRQASRVAGRAGTGGRFLSELFKHADNAANNIRSQSGLDAEQISVSSAVTLMLRRLASERKIRTILLVGAGKMISLAAEDLADLPGIEVWVANRTVQKAKDLASRVKGTAIDLTGIPSALNKADAVLTCTSSTDYVIGTEELRSAVEKRQDKQLIVIDLAVPRNINPDAKRIAGVRVYDIDDLAPFGEEHRKLFQPRLEDAERLALEETKNFYARVRAYDANDLLRDLRKVAEEIREAELSRALRKLGDVPNREKTILDLLTRRIVNKLLYEPTLRLKEHATNGDDETYEAVLRELFDIGRQNQQ
jgi:glutamyl-tRNA reductase